MTKRGTRFFAARLLFSKTFMVVIFLVFAATAHAAGFGITPPYVKNDSLTRGSKYDQHIILVRDDSGEDLDVKVTTNVPKADRWLSVAQGSEFVFPKGAQQVPMDIQVNVPNDAAFGDYTGNIRVVISPHGGPQAGTVGITLGAQIDVDLKVTDKVLSSFKIHGIQVSNTEEGHKFWWFYFPAKIKFTMNVENTGNIPGGPSRVTLTIYKPGSTQPLEVTQNTNNIEQVDPFQVKEVTAEIPTTMKAGGYSAAYTIYNGDSVAQQGMVDLNVLPPGSIPGYIGYGLDGIGVTNQLILIGIGVAILFALYWAGRSARRSMRRKKAMRDTPIPRPR
jgi:hypothetical protein